MKIRYYSRLTALDGLALYWPLSAYLLSGGNAEIQWLGWGVACFSCSIWLYMGYKDKDIPRALMELMYLCLAIRGIVNWIQ